jgi:hypothetical protein
VPEWAAPTPRPIDSPAPPARISELGTRSAIIRARETYRERSRLQATRANEISRLTAKTERAQSSNDGIDFNTPITDLSKDVDAGGARGTEQELGAQPPVSQTDEFSIPLVNNEPVIRPTSSTLDRDWNHQEARTETSFAVASDNETLPPIAEPEAPELTWLGDRTDSVSATMQADAQPWSADGDDEFSQYDAGQSASYETLPSNRTDQASGEQIWPELLNAAGYEAQDHEAEHDTEDVVSGNDFDGYVTSPPNLDLAAHLPRVCRTCRDFRPAENGERGWCANQWAFSHRRMVDADERTPCEGVLGNWWLPVDEVWSEAADVSSHGQPTPLLNAWLPQPLQSEPTRRRS